jgi:hypothetical protein
MIIPSAVGRISIDVQLADPLPLKFNTTGVAGSVVLAFTFITITPVCVPALMAVNAAFTVANEPEAVPVVAVSVTCPQIFPTPVTKTARIITNEASRLLKLFFGWKNGFEDTVSFRLLTIFYYTVLQLFIKYKLIHSCQ